MNPLIFLFQAIALAKLGRLEESLTVLRGVLNIDKPDQKDKHTFFEETVCIFFFQYNG